MISQLVNPKNLSTAIIKIKHRLGMAMAQQWNHSQCLVIAVL